MYFVILISTVYTLKLSKIKLKLYFYYKVTKLFCNLNKNVLNMEIFPY